MGCFCYYLLNLSIPLWTECHCSFQSGSAKGGFAASFAAVGGTTSAAPGTGKA